MILTNCWAGFVLIRKARTGTDSLETLDRLVVAFASSIGWGRIMWTFRVQRSIGPSILPIVNALLDTAPFMFVMMVSLIALIHALCIFYQNDILRSAIISLNIGLFGEFEAAQNIEKLLSGGYSSTDVAREEQGSTSMFVLTAR